MYQAILRILHLLLLFFSVSLYGQDVSEVAGSWSGYIDLNDQKLSVNVTFSYSAEILDGTIDIPDRGIFTLPVEVVDSNENKLVFQFETGKGPAVFHGIRNETNDRISGEFSQSGESFPFRLTRNNLVQGFFKELPESEVIIPTDNGRIGGSLVLHRERSPLVILVSGSGSKDRNQDISGFKIFQQLAYRLYAEGYSTFRYDDRGVGESTGETDVTLQEMGSDLGQVIDYLQAKYNGEMSRLILLGHNQGGLVAAMAAHDAPVDGLILAATPFQRGDEIITEQIQKISEVRDIPEEVVRQNLDFQEKVYHVVRTGAGWQEIENDLAGRLEQQIRELPPEHQNALGDMSAFIQSQVDRQLETAKSRWFKSWIETDPDEVISDLNVPIFAFFGEKDTQVLPEGNKLAADSLASTSKISLQTAIIPGANHLFQEANTGMPTEYSLLDPKFADDFIRQIDQFLDSVQFNAPD